MQANGVDNMANMVGRVSSNDRRTGTERFCSKVDFVPEMFVSGN